VKKERIIFVHTRIDFGFFTNGISHSSPSDVAKFKDLK